MLGGLVLVALIQRWLVPRLDFPALQTWSTIFVAMVLQALPFLVGGVLLAAAISAFVTEDRLRRLTPRSPWLGVPAAGAAGIALPGCECASVPVAAGLVRRGVAPAVAFTFMLAAPAVNPVVLVSTAVAFSGRTDMVAARFAASMATAVLVGWWWQWRGGGVPLLATSRHQHATGWRGFADSARHDVVHAGGFLVAGAAIAAAVSALLPRAVLDAVAGSPVLAVLALATFAFVVAMCSEADAFVAASLTMFSDTAKLVFLVVGPAMDVKLAAMGAGTFGSVFAARFVPVVLLVAVGCAVLTGTVLL
ncbi:permease [Nocardioides caricicola]